MKEAIKQISLLILALSLNLVWANSSFNDIAFFQIHLSACSEYSDSSDLLEYSHSICCEDDVFMDNAKVKSDIFNIRNDIVSVLIVNFQNDYLNNVWQPPKFS